MFVKLLFNHSIQESQPNNINKTGKGRCVCFTETKKKNNWTRTSLQQTPHNYGEVEHG